MKIAFIGQKGIPATVGGVETHVERLAIGLKKIGHEVFVYTRPWYAAGKKLKTYRGVNVVYLGSLKTKNFDTITHVLLASLDVLKKNYDIVHYHGVGPALLAWIPRWFKPQTKVIITFHSIDRHHQKWGLLARWFLRLGEYFAVKFAHETIAVSKTLQRYANQHYHGDTIYIPNGIDLPRIRTSDRVIKKKWGLRQQGYILFMSRLVKHKGAHYLIDAYQQLKTDKQLVIAGGAAFTENYVKSLKTMKGRNKNIIFTGNVKMFSPEWYELYSNAYCFVLPSESEGLPFVVLEAMSFERCVLASDIPQNVEVIAHGFGFVHKNKDVDDLRKKLRFILDNPKIAAKTGVAARRHVDRNYNWRNIVKAIESVYLGVLAVDGRRKLKHCVRKMMLEN